MGLEGLEAKSTAGGALGPSTCPLVLAGLLCFGGAFATPAAAVSAGVLALNGSPTSAVTVNAGAVLAGAGTITGAVTVTSGGVLAPGSSPGILNTGSLSLEGGSNLPVELNGPTGGTQYDQVNVIGNVTLDGGLLDVSLGFASATGQVFTIINNDADEPVTGTFAGLGEGSTLVAGGLLFRISYAGGTGNDVTLTTLATPSLTGEASPSVTVGGSVSHQATLAGGFNPSGAITFNLFAPDDAGCASSIFTSTAAVSGNGSYVSGTFTTSAAGIYLWTASYGGDGYNLAATTPCGDESVVVTVANPGLSAQASPSSIEVGGSLSDLATISGGHSPTGTITFDLFAPDDEGCASSIFSSTMPVSGNGTYISDSSTAVTLGTYRWVASYSGDANNAAAGPTACSDPAQQAVVGGFTAVIPTLSTWGLISMALLLAGMGLIMARRTSRNG